MLWRWGARPNKSRQQSGVWNGAQGNGGIGEHFMCCSSANIREYRQADWQERGIWDLGSLLVGPMRSQQPLCTRNTMIDEFMQQGFDHRLSRRSMYGTGPSEVLPSYWGHIMCVIMWEGGQEESEAYTGGSVTDILST